MKISPNRSCQYEELIVNDLQSDYFAAKRYQSNLITDFFL